MGVNTALQQGKALSWEEKASKINLITNKSNMVQSSFPAEGERNADGRYHVISQIYYSSSAKSGAREILLCVCLLVNVSLEMI